jgi:hypothetical protein
VCSTATLIVLAATVTVVDLAATPLMEHVTA